MLKEKTNWEQYFYILQLKKLVHKLEILRKPKY